MNNNVGSTIRNIRTNKKYSQQYVVNEVMTQSAFSKFELEKVDINYSSLESILHSLEMSFEEFTYIQNDYQYMDRDIIFNSFISLSYNNEEDIIELQRMAAAYLEKKKDILIKDIELLYDSLLILLRNNDSRAFTTNAILVWKRLSTKDQLYIADLYLLNSIFHLFPVETTFEIQKLAYKSINRYKYFQNIQRLKINFGLNFSLILLKEKMYEQALKEIETTIIASKKQKTYLQLAVCYVRKGICLNCIDKSGSNWIEKGLDLISVLEEDDLLLMLESEINLYSGI